MRTKAIIGTPHGSRSWRCVLVDEHGARATVYAKTFDQGATALQRYSAMQSGTLYSVDIADRLTAVEREHGR